MSERVVAAGTRGARPVWPRALVFRGVVPASGLLFDEGLLGEAEARRRVLRLWHAGSRLYRVGSTLCLVWPAPRRMRCESAEGTPLLSRDGALLALPLDPDELQALSPAPQTLVRAAAGVVELVRLDAASALDPADWLDVAGVPLLEATPLGALPPPPALAAPPPVVDRDSFHVGAAPPERDSLLARLRKTRQVAADRKAGRPAAATATAAPDDGPPGAWASPRTLGFAGVGFAIGLVALLGGGGAVVAGRLVSVVFTALILTRVLPLISAAGPSTPALPSAPRSADGTGARGESPPPRSRLGALLTRLYNRALVASQLHRLIGRQYGRYLEKLFEDLERGDLDEALRRAIPLSDVPSQEEQRIALQLAPRRRDQLRATLGMPAGGGSIGVSGDLFGDMRRRYRQAFDRLVAAGRIDEAAFVLADLLGDVGEAISFLERNGRARFAAELAEARSQPPAVQIRQWVIAGDPARAVTIARRSGAFAEAVAQLERTHPKLAEVLRLGYGEALAEAGRYAAAVDVVWPLGDEGRAIARPWAERGVAAGGVVEARLLPRLLALAPEQLPAVLDRARAIFGAEEPDTDERKRALTLAIAAAEPTADAAPRHALLARLALRTLPATDLRQKLARLAEDAVLDADLRALPPDRRARIARPPLHLTIDAADVGATPIHDAALLPDGRLVLGLGEGGVRILRRDGSLQARLDGPADKLVISDDGTRAIAVARRARTVRLTRIDLSARVSTDWCDAMIGLFADTFDGSLWFATGADGLLGVDALAPRFTALWRVADLPNDITGLAREPTGLALTIDVSSVETGATWRYSLPDLVLRSRQPQTELVAPSGGRDRLWCDQSLDADGHVEFFQIVRDDGGGRSLLCQDGARGSVEERPIPSEYGALSVVRRGGHQVIGLRSGDGVVDDSDGRPTTVEVRPLLPHERSVDRILLHAPGANRVNLRLCGAHGDLLVVSDRCGRLLVLHVPTGEVVRNYRL